MQVRSLELRMEVRAQDRVDLEALVDQRLTRFSPGAAWAIDVTVDEDVMTTGAGVQLVMSYVASVHATEIWPRPDGGS